MPFDRCAVNYRLFSCTLCNQSYFWVDEILLLEDAIAPPISKSTHTVVVGLEKEGDLNGKGFYRGTLRNGVLRSSDKGQKHPASPEHRSGSVPFECCQGEIPDRSRELFRRGFCCLSGAYYYAPRIDALLVI